MPWLLFESLWNWSHECMMNKQPHAPWWFDGRCGCAFWFVLKYDITLHSLDLWCGQAEALQTCPTCLRNSPTTLLFCSFLCMSLLQMFVSLDDCFCLNKVKHLNNNSRCPKVENIYKVPNGLCDSYFSAVWDGEKRNISISPSESCGLFPVGIILQGWPNLTYRHVTVEKDRCR